jgi:acetyl-CoA carboxylase biotin carboxyl carrier protein
MRIGKINKLIELLENHDIDEIELSNWFSKVRIAKKGGAIFTEQEGQAEGQKLSRKRGSKPATTAEPGETGKAALETEEEKNNRVEIKSPIVGTFYRAPAPDSEPFVEVGDSFATGDTLCIVEAMKVMNEIEAEFSGKIVKIMVENSEPVEYDQPLFIVDKQ